MNTPADNLVPITGNPLIDGLTYGAAWQFGGGAHTLTYSLSFNDNPSGGAWTTELSNAARQALSAWSNVANITFVESGSGTVYSESPADMALILTGNDLQSGIAGVVGIGIPPSPSFADTLLVVFGETRSTYPHPEGDVALDNSYNGFLYLDPGGIGRTIMLHEIGHALGLKHTDDGSNDRPTFASLGISNLDSQLYTVMSYTDANGHPLGYSLFENAATPMLLDILAIQEIYGANTSYHTGNDVYTLYGASPYMASTIWDAGGNDTLGAGSVNQFNNVTLDLREGHFSLSPTMSGYSMAIAYGVVIENAIGGDGNDALIGNAVDNRLEGGVGNDTLDGGAGADTLVGGIGNDVFLVDNIADSITENGGEGIESIQSSVTYTLAANLENLTLTGSAAINGIGNSLDNILTGNSGDNTLDGAAGTDTLAGGLGNDTYLVDLAATGTLQDPITEVAVGGTDTVQLRGSVTLASAATLTLAVALENLDAGATGSTRLNLTGNAAGNILTGNAADNILSGGTGVDTLIGGMGDDTYTVDNIADRVIESDGEGTDMVKVGIVTAIRTYTLGDHIENGTVIGTVAFKLTGNTQDNILTGNAGADTLIGGAGADTLTGGDGADTYVVDDAGDRIIETSALAAGGNDLVQSAIGYVLGDNLEKLTLTGSTAINGTGNSLANTLTGNSGNNTLNGAAGIDTLIGGAGNDVFVVDSLTDVVTELADGGSDWVLVDTALTSGSFAMAANVEYGILGGTNSLNLSGNAANNGLVGNNGANVLDGSAGNDTLDGGSGNDTLMGGAGNDMLNGQQGSDRMEGGTGNDSYTINRGDGAGTAITANEDTVVELAAAGTDTVVSAVYTYTLDANVENLVLGGNIARKGFGNAADNLITGNGLNNLMNGEAGNDTLGGAAGNDTVNGGIGNDRLDGGLGKDVMSGGAGNDTFVFSTALSATTNSDRITDFSAGLDTIVLSNSIFTALGAVGGLNADFFYAGTSAHDASDRIIFNASNGALYYDADGDGSTALQVQFATLAAASALASSDFIVGA